MGFRIFETKNFKKEEKKKQHQFSVFVVALLTAAGWRTYQAGAAEYAEVQTARLRQLHDRL